VENGDNDIDSKGGGPAGRGRVEEEGGGATGAAAAGSDAAVASRRMASGAAKEQQALLDASHRLVHPEHRHPAYHHDWGESQQSHIAQSFSALPSAPISGTGLGDRDSYFYQHHLRGEYVRIHRDDFAELVASVKAMEEESKRFRSILRKYNKHYGTSKISPG